MKEIHLSTIKKESVDHIFRVIAENEQVSRAAIAQATSLSLMTVGKVVDALLEHDVIVQTKESKNAAGRKAGLVRLNAEKFCVILDLTSLRFSLTVIDVTLHVLDKMEYEYSEDFYYEENIYLFLKNVKIFALRRLEWSNCIGVGVCVPGKYNEMLDTVEDSRIPELSTIHIRGILHDILSENVTLIEMDTAAAAVSNMYMIDHYMEKIVAYISLNTENINSTVLYHGEPLFGTLGCDLGKMLVRGGHTLSDVLLENGIENETFPDLVMALYNYILCVRCDTIVIENALPCTVEQPEKRLREQLTTLLRGHVSLPDFVISRDEIPHAHRGLALQMRRLWLKEISAQ